MRREICDVCDAIYHHGRRSGDGKAIILFGHLFTVSWSKNLQKRRLSFETIRIFFLNYTFPTIGVKERREVAKKGKLKFEKKNKKRGSKRGHNFGFSF